MSSEIEFVEFPKMARLARECIVTEKIDGTNACLFIGESGEFLIGSRSQWITPERDNHGFARWAMEHREELVAGLGVGRHFGEWWGSGIQRGYGLAKGEKRLSLFNVTRWCRHDEEPAQIPGGDPSSPPKFQQRLPACVGLVPVLARGMFSTLLVEDCMNVLRKCGSQAAPGFMRPEGVVVFHVAGSVGFKRTLEKDESPKSALAVQR